MSSSSGPVTIPSSPCTFFPRNSTTAPSSLTPLTDHSPSSNPLLHLPPGSLSHSHPLSRTTVVLLCPTKVFRVLLLNPSTCRCLLLPLFLSSLTPLPIGLPTDLPEDSTGRVLDYVHRYSTSSGKTRVRGEKNLDEKSPLRVTMFPRVPCTPRV